MKIPLACIERYSAAPQLCGNVCEAPRFAGAKPSLALRQRSAEKEVLPNTGLVCLLPMRAGGRAAPGPKPRGGRR